MSKKPKQPKPPRVPVPLSALELQFQDQLTFLERSCRDFDEGHTAEYRRIALAIRILVYSSASSHSLIGQLDMADAPLASYATPAHPGNLVAWHPLVMMRISNAGAAFVPVLDQGPPHKGKWLPFSDWWHEEVFRSPEGVVLTRGDFVTIVANQDGGAHVDPELDERYHKLAHENLAGWIASGPEGDSPLLHIEKMHLRQIGFETLKSLEAAWLKRLGNRLCDCGSGRKHRYCCGKGAA